MRVRQGGRAGRQRHQHGARSFRCLPLQLFWRGSFGTGIMHAATSSVSPAGNPRPKMVASGPGTAQQAASAEAALSEPDSILEVLQANNRATCLSPLPLLHWLYVTYVVDEKYEPHYPQTTTMGSRQPGSSVQRNV